MYKEYKEKEGEVVSGVVQRIEGRNVYMDLGKSVGVLFPSEQIVSGTLPHRPTDESVYSQSRGWPQRAGNNFEPRLILK